MRGLLLSLLLVSWPACERPVLDVNAVPGLGEKGRAAYAEFLLTNVPRVFASAPGDRFGWQGGTGTIETARAKALEQCARAGQPPCTIVAENLEVVGRPGPTVTVPGPFTSTWNYAIVPDSRYFWRGAQAAAGVFVWGHGLGRLNGAGGLADARGSQPQGYVRAFNNAGFDVVRFERDPNSDDRERAAGWLEESLTDLRRRGYRRVVVGGQSRGAWNSLQMLTHAGLADAVVAVSPAAHGSGASTNLSAQYDDLRQLVGDVPAARTRLAFVQFAMDTFAGDLAGRRALIERLRPRLGGLLIIDQPDGFAGHFGGNTALFGQRYGPCLVRFVLETAPAAGC